MAGEPDPVYVRARRVLLDALEALKPHLDAVVLVGAQAIYLHTGEGDLAVAPYTTDGDLALAPDLLLDTPLLADSLARARFTPGNHPGCWVSPDGIVIDLMVPASLGGPGSRGARLGIHGKRAARKAKGLEAALVDRMRIEISALDAADSRKLRIWVAGPAALLIAKLHKIGERAASPSRRENKDALDVLRLLRHVSTKELAERLQQFQTDPTCADVTRTALELLERLFSAPDTIGSQMAVRATERLEDPDTIAQSCAILASDLLAVLSD
jgi:hypothetical protein